MREGKASIPRADLGGHVHGCARGDFVALGLFYAGQASFQQLDAELETGYSVNLFGHGVDIV